MERRPLHLFEASIMEDIQDIQSGELEHLVGFEQTNDRSSPSSRTFIFTARDPRTVRLVAARSEQHFSIAF